MQITLAGKTVHIATGEARPRVGQPSLLFIHGAGMTHTVWALQSRYFASRGRNVLAVDLPGHGGSEGAALDSIPALADWIVALLEQLDLGQAALIGHSMGALVALDAAARYPEWVSALGLLGVAADMPVNQALLDAAAEDRAAAIDMMTGWGFGPAGLIGGNRQSGGWMLGGIRALMLNNIRAFPGALYCDLKACNDYADGRRHAGAVTQPTFVVTGAVDLMTPARAGRKLAQAMTGVPHGAALIELPAVGHMMMQEAPDAVLDAMLAANL